MIPSGQIQRDRGRLTCIFQSMQSGSLSFPFQISYFLFVLVVAVMFMKVEEKFASWFDAFQSAIFGQLIQAASPWISFHGVSFSSSSSSSSYLLLLLLLYYIYFSFFLSCFVLQRHVENRSAFHRHLFGFISLLLFSIHRAAIPQEKIPPPRGKPWKLPHPPLTN